MPPSIFPQHNNAHLQVSGLGRVIFQTALAPAIWGSTYLLFTKMLPVSHPLTMAAIRSIPAGLLLLALSPHALSRATFPQILILGTLNIAAFSGLLFVAAARLPGGIAATLASTQPLFAILLAWPVLKQRPGGVSMLSAIAGLFAVWMLGNDPGAMLAPTGVASAVVAAGSMAAGVVLMKRFRQLLPPTSMAAWQLILGGGLLLVVGPALEGPPPPLDAGNVTGLALLVLLGTALPFYLWTKGVRELGAGASFLGLLSPLVAMTLGTLFADESLSLRQLGPIVLLLSASALGATCSPAQPLTRKSP